MNSANCDSVLNDRDARKLCEHLKGWIAIVTFTNRHSPSYYVRCGKHCAIFADGETCPFADEFVR